MALAADSHPHFTTIARFIASLEDEITPLFRAEPVFGNICHALGLRYFNHRGKVKVDIQWKLFGMVHNLGKIASYGRRFANATG